MKCKAAMALAAVLSASPIVAVSAAEVAQAQPNVMFCTETDNHGFSYNQQRRRYENASFEQARYTVNIMADFSSIRIVNTARQSIFNLQCRISNFTVTHPHVRECTDGSGFNFTYNTQNQRFTFSQQYGYVYGDGDSIHIAYGTCQRF
ncbi:MAG: hypothetical protein H9535_16565 [Ignavibacteria bacterium]|nr:hypothetical protein [Ignavibacteria bacterium]